MSEDTRGYLCFIATGLVGLGCYLMFSPPINRAFKIAAVLVWLLAFWAALTAITP